MKVVFLPLLFIFELIQQAGLVNFMLFLSILKILKISFETFWRKIFEKTLRVPWKKKYRRVAVPFPGKISNGNENWFCRVELLEIFLYLKEKYISLTTLVFYGDSQLILWKKTSFKYRLAQIIFQTSYNTISCPLLGNWHAMVLTTRKIYKNLCYLMYC